jgi:hypothetical protein
MYAHLGRHLHILKAFHSASNNRTLRNPSNPSPINLAVVPAPAAPMEVDVAACEAFYDGCPAVPGRWEEEIAAFFRHHAPDGKRLARPVVCVTSGGTTVPMERNCVRYIDNFSAGTRGAMSTQEFLEVRRRQRRARARVDAVLHCMHHAPNPSPPACSSESTPMSAGKTPHGRLHAARRDCGLAIAANRCSCRPKIPPSPPQPQPSPQAGYAVIFLTRTGSVQPWTLELPAQGTVQLLQEILRLEEASSGAESGSAHSGGGGGGSDAQLRLAGRHEARVAALLKRVAAVQRQRLLLTLPFTTIFEYLQVRATHGGRQGARWGGAGGRVVWGGPWAGAAGWTGSARRKFAAKMARS